MTWSESALCCTEGHDRSLWFADFDVPDRFDPYAEARPICQRCPVVEECLEHALANDETDGMWGGMSPGERKQLARSRR